MPRTEETNQQIQAERREHILGVAAKIFAQKGLSDAKMAEIAKAAGMSYGLTYRYFASKEVLFAVLVERVMNGTIQLTQEMQAQPRTPWEKLCWLTEQFMRDLQERPEYALVIVHALTNQTVAEQVREMARLQARTMVKVVRGLIEEGQKQGQMVEGNPEQLALLYLASLQGLTVTLVALREEAVYLPDSTCLLSGLQKR